MTNEEIKLLKNFITWQSLPFVDNLFTHEDETIKKFDEWLRLNAVEQQPKTGHWIGETICSNCNHIKMIAWKFNFCPICGIDMRESEEEEE